jgi:hypothetical protein
VAIRPRHGGHRLAASPNRGSSTASGVPSPPGRAGDCRWDAITGLRIGVALANPRALRFWQRLGYVETGEVKLADPGRFPIAVLEKPLVRTPRA